MRVRFNEVFATHGDGSVSAKAPTVIGGVRLEPGQEFGCRIRVGTFHFAGVRGRDLEVDREGGITYVLRHYALPQRPERPLPRHRTHPEVALPIEV
ncbi:MAG TPA: hypothetical protein VM327_01780 [Candidatus Thermoplasmatota archaeon]|nr:hypothetical protein [Candidatus Thermoplasmatota archaeon]